MTPSGELSSPPSQAITLPLPAKGASTTPQTPSGTRLGLLFVFLVSGLAFLLASFPARNSDVWLHLARGRLVAHGQYPATTNPDLDFDLWGNQTWLYDLCCYGCHAVVGEAGMVFVKALLAAGIALLLLRQSRPDQGWCVAVLCTSLAILTMSKYLSLQPATVSYLFLALALAVLFSPRTVEKEARPPLVSWPLLLLFVVWANSDRWFLLGLGVVALAWLGETVDVALSAGTSPQRAQANLIRRGISFLILAVVCLVNPSHVDAFVLLDELRGLGLSAAQRISPFESDYFVRLGWNPASLAYFLLFGASLLSFAALLPRLRWRRFLPWLGLATLSVFQMRGIPFFAIVAGPVLAWNLRDIHARFFSQVRKTAQGAELLRFGQVLTGMLVLALFVCAWPGWLQSPPYGMRRWAFDLPVSLKRVAQTVRQWHEEGKLPAESGGLHLSPDTVFAFAWFCPEENRLRLAHEESLADFQKRMRANNVDHILVHNTDPNRLSLALMGFLAEPEQWPMLCQEGDAAVFGWRDPARRDSANRFRGWEVNVDRLAFHPAEAKKAPAVSLETPETQPWWHAFWKAAPSRSTDRGEALLHLLHAQALRGQAPMKTLTVWSYSQAAALVAAANTWSFPTALGDAELRLGTLGLQLSADGRQPEQPSPLELLTMGFLQHFRLQRDDVPPALLYLAVRAARRAVAANPEDELAYLLLGESYIGLLDATRERAWSAQLPQLLKLRQAQASAALNRAITLRPDFPQAHLQLALLYQNMGYRDLTLQHLQIYQGLVQAAGQPQGVDRDKFLAGLKQTADRIDRLAPDVQRRQSTFDLRSAESPPRERAYQAYRSGLAGKALELLLASDRSAFGDEGMRLELDLLLDVGRARDVQEWLRPEHEKALTSLPYHWYRVRALAALGDYTQAEEECDEAARSLAQRPDSTEPVRLRENMALMAAKLVLDVDTTEKMPLGSLLAQIHRVKAGEGIDELAQRMKRQSDLTALHGLLALEEGEIAEAESAFRAALGLRKGQPINAADSSWDFNSRILVQDCLRWLE